ncbi:metal ABC transporter permease [Comamonas piscis]|uniref:Metal ABC transporter permease n=1 Tax=Comamonas piscis TaxID=1562974 RepID=A0A7G5ECZ0_9BURK|nr:metal ABC transporter permease [Comamonas piscis]QMV71865.1 metal ABC transporter permease [Comamonas piscis]WSO34600.1 metal ABC transporter permease [Comamonas piscis]
MIDELLWQPFVDYGFMRRALAGCLALSAGAAPLGTILLLRRMSLVGDAMSHAILPGAAMGYLLFGLSLPAMTIGGLAAGLIVALLSGVVTRYTALREDASFAGFYLISLALGVLLISLRGSNVDLLHVLFGSVLALDDPTLYLTATIASLSMLGLALMYRPLLMECLDPGFLRLQGRMGSISHGVFMLLLVLNLVGGFHSLGTLMAVALVVLPAASARFWLRGVGLQMALSTGIAMAGSVLGLLLSFHAGIAASAAITLSLGSLYLLSLCLGRLGSVWAQRQAPANDSVTEPMGVSE